MHRTRKTLVEPVFAETPPAGCSDGRYVNGLGRPADQLDLLSTDNPFADGRVLTGVVIYSGATRLAEMAARSGFDVVWIEMEHGPADFAQVEAMCVSIEAGGAIPVVRIPDVNRHHVLRTLEVGARIVVGPMVNTPQQAADFVRHGKFPPLGERGFNIRSRGVDYGLGDRATMFQRVNERTHLFAQIETMEAVENVAAIADVAGLSGIFVGPGDLSVSAGCAGDLNGPRLIGLVTHCIRTARAMGKNAGILIPPGPLLDAAMQAGCNFALCGGDVPELQTAWTQLRSRVSAAIPTLAPAEAVPARPTENGIPAAVVST